MNLGCGWRLGEHPEMCLWIFLSWISSIVFWTCLTFCSKLLRRVPQSHIPLPGISFVCFELGTPCFGLLWSNSCTRTALAAFSPSHPLLTSLWTLQVSIIPSSVIPLPGWIPACPFAPYSNTSNQSMMDHPFSDGFSLKFLQNCYNRIRTAHNFQDVRILPIETEKCLPFPSLFP